MMTAATATLLDPLMGDPEITAILGDHGLVCRMLRFEAALAKAQAKLGLIPQEAARAIDAAASAGLDLTALAAATAVAGNPAIPLVKMLTASTAAEGRAYVHWGATSQDVMDTAIILQLQECLALMGRNLDRLGGALAALTLRHRHTPMIARTLLQQALPSRFGLKTAGWLSGISRAKTRLGEMGPRLLAVQLGGAAGTLASLGREGGAVGRELARLLGLSHADLPWHTQRDRLAEVACFCGILTGTLGKIARDIGLMAQTEIGELREGAAPGRGGSSTMPHKRNPISCNVVLAAATAVPPLVATVLASQVQDHERGLGGWAAEWRSLPELMRLSAGALRHCCELIEGLEVDEARMAQNLEVTHGLVMAEAVMMALAPFTGRLTAHHLIEAACAAAAAQKRHLRDVLLDDPAVTAHLGADDLARLFDAGHYTGSADLFIDAALKAWPCTC